MQGPFGIYGLQDKQMAPILHQSRYCWSGGPTARASILVPSFPKGLVWRS